MSARQRRSTISDDKMSVNYKRSEIRISVLFGFRKTIVDGMIEKRDCLSSLLEQKQISLFYRNSHKAILNPHQHRRKTKFFQKFLHALLFLEKAGSSVSVFVKIDVGYDFFKLQKSCLIFVYLKYYS